MGLVFAMSAGMRNSTRRLFRLTAMMVLAGAACVQATGDDAGSAIPGSAAGGSFGSAAGPGAPSPAPGPTGSGGSSAGSSGSAPPSDPGSAPVMGAPAPGMAPSEEGAPPPSPPPAPPPPSSNPAPQSGLLTAGSWDDNLNYDFFKKYIQRTSLLPGVPQAAVSDRLIVRVTDAAGAPLAGARVSVQSQQKEVAFTLTGADGRALFFPNWSGLAGGENLTVVATVGAASATGVARAGDAMLTLPVAAAASPVTALDVAILIDTTGSMGDEIRYLQAELLNISTALAELVPTLSQRWAFVAYRDYQDNYVTRKSELVDDVAAFRAQFAGLSAGGGGDYEEAPERGFADLDTLQWRDGAVARVAFWVGDAPHHSERAPELLQGIRALKAKGVHIYPISASGASELLEYSMRLAAMVTGGRYLFLTDDSGVGGAHKEPTIPCYLVTTLQKAMLRMLQMELTGTHVDPAPADVLRNGGDPQNGRCQLSSGEVVEVL